MISKNSSERERNKLYYGDNLQVLREYVAAESIDLIYLDPPFKSDQIYNALSKDNTELDFPTQIEAFDDAWTWTQETESQYLSLVRGGAPLPVAAALETMHRLISEGDHLAYLTMMTARLIELHRVLRRTGSIFLHCDPTVSHYLKIITDSIFGPENFRNEIVWRRTQAKSRMTRRLPSSHDIILAYGKSPKALWNEKALFRLYNFDGLDEKTKAKYSQRDPDGRRYQLTSLINPNPNRPNLTYEFLGVTQVWRWTRERMQEAYDAGLVVQTRPGQVPRQKRYLDEQRGKPLADVWTDIPPLNVQAAERLGYPTQKPVELLVRIIEAASQPGDVVLDPFAGCGTTIDAAQKLKRRWVGIDITALAIDLIDARLRYTYSETIRSSYEILGIPRDLLGAETLFHRSPFEFERWCVMQVGGQPNEKQVGDRGVDGVIRIPIDTKGDSHRVLVSVKGGESNPGHVRDLIDMMESQHAAMGLFICLRPPSSGIKEAANYSGIYRYPVNGKEYPKVQILAVEDLLNGKRPNLPAALLPYFQAQPRHSSSLEQLKRI